MIRTIEPILLIAFRHGHKIKMAFGCKGQDECERCFIQNPARSCHFESEFLSRNEWAKAMHNENENV